VLLLLAGQPCSTAWVLLLWLLLALLLLLLLLMAVSCPLLAQRMLSSCSSRRCMAWLRAQSLMGATWGMRVMGVTMTMPHMQTQGVTC
jgi:hypothetical protein